MWRYNEISAQDILQGADVGRSTYDAQYQNKDDLLTSGFEHLLDALVRGITLDGNGRMLFDVRMLFEHALGHYQVYRTLIWGSGFELLIGGDQAALGQKIEAHLEGVLSGHPPRRSLHRWLPAPSPEGCWCS